MISYRILEISKLNSRTNLAVEMNLKAEASIKTSKGLVVPMDPNTVISMLAL